LNQTISIMRRFRFLIISTVVLFLLINTEYYWEGLFFGFDLFLKWFYIIFFLILIICLVRHIVLIIKERFKNRQRIYLTLIMSLFLGLIYTKPFGIINFEKFEARDVLEAMQEGAGNCTITLKLKENKKFTITSLCFGEDKMHGTYSLKADTIKLNFSILSIITKRYQYGIYNKESGEVLMYTSKNDTMPYPLTVFKNELIK